MAINRTIAPTVAAIFLAAASISVTKPILLAQSTAKSLSIAVGPQYDTKHVYLAPEDFDRFTASWTATFGGTTSKQGVFTVTPTPSSTISQLVYSPVGNLSVFGFKTPIPFPFGAERTGYLAADDQLLGHLFRACAWRRSRQSGGFLLFWTRSQECYLQPGHSPRTAANAGRTNRRGSSATRGFAPDDPAL